MRDAADVLRAVDLAGRFAVFILAAGLRFVVVVAMLASLSTQANQLQHRENHCRFDIARRERAMGWKRLTRGERKYVVNLNNVAYLQELGNGTRVVYAASSGENDARLTITVDETPGEILSAEDVT